MDAYYTLKEQAKLLRWKLRRLQAARQYGADALEDAPIVIGNAIPKAGSHLISQLLRGLTHLGPFINTGFPPLNRWEDNRKLPKDRIVRNIERLRSGDIAYGYLPSQPQFLNLLTRENTAAIFVYRDPRDVVVSAVKYGMYVNPNHAMNAYYFEHLSTDEERYNAIINGVTEPGFEISGIRTRFEWYEGWLNTPQVLCINFEELILNQKASINRIMTYLKTFGFESKLNDEETTALLQNSLIPEKSGTFRKGKPGGWKENFTQNNIDTFKRVAGSILIKYGYEIDQNWQH